MFKINTASRPYIELYAGTTEDVRVLVQMGASPSKPDKDRGWTLAFYAVCTNKKATIRILESYLLPDFAQTVDFYGRSILHVAIETDNPEIMCLALDLAADPHHLLRTRAEDGKGIHENTLY
jgi:ankyrin repeat protein